MLTRTVKWGHSLAIRIPKTVAVECGLSESSEVDISCSDRTIMVKPVAKKVTLDDLLSLVTPENIHGEVDFGRPIGKELI